MAHYVGIDVGYRDVGAVTIAPDGSASSHYVAPEVPPFPICDALADADAPHTLLETFVDALADERRGASPSSADSLETADFEGFQIAGIQQQLGTEDAVAVRGRTFTPADVVTRVVSGLLSVLSVPEGAYAVVAVPHDFDDTQRAAAEEAAAAAGVNVVDVMDRHAAAALNCGPALDSADRVCVYEYGDTSRSTVLDTEDGALDHVASTEGKSPTRATFDNALATHVASQYVERDEAVNYRAEAVQRVASRVRSELRTGDTVTVEPGEFPGLDGPLVLDAETVEEATRDVVHNTLAATDDLFDAPEVEVFPWQVDALVLTGDVARVPPVADAVEDLFEADVIETEWTPLPTAGGAALGALANVPTDLAPKDVLTDDEDEETRDADGDAESPDESGAGPDAPETKTDNRWWTYAAWSFLTPILLFVALMVGYAIRTPPDDSTFAGYPVMTSLVFAFTISLLACPLVFALATSRDKRHLDAVTGDARPRHFVTILIVLVVTYGVYSLFYVARRRQKYGDSVFPRSVR